MQFITPFFFAIVFWFTLNSTQAQVFPSDTTLNFTSVPLTFPPVINAERYHITLEQLGTLNKTEINRSGNLHLLEGLNWNQSYRWKYTAHDEAGKQVYASPNFRFLIKGNDRTDKSKQRLEIIPHEGEHASDYLFLDHALSAVDRNGDFVWFLPENERWNGQWERLRDIRLTDFGTITFIHEGLGIFETDLAGNILWMVESPIKDTAMSKRYFHHEFFRRGDHYFVLGMENVEKQFSVDTVVQTIPYDIILEYDQAGKVVWEWHAKDYFIDEEFIAMKGEKAFTPGQGHMNSLSISEDGKYLYGGFRNISRVVKIKKKNGKVVSSYGQHLVKGRAKVGDGWFRRQHCALILPDHRILLFNNDSVADPTISSSLVIFDEGAKKTEDGPLWEFDLKFDSLSDARCTQTGGVQMLPNGNILANLGTVNRILEVTPGKKVVWDAFIQQKSPMEKDKWVQFPQYRVHSSPTLWPVLYSVQLREGDSPTIQIRNEGTVSDSYLLEIYPGGEEAAILKSIGEIAPGEAKLQHLPVKSMDGVILKIHSSRNPDLSQTYSW